MNPELLKAITLSSLIAGIVIIIISIGALYFAYLTKRKNKKEISKIFVLTILWGIFIFLKFFSLITTENQKKLLEVYSLFDLAAIITGIITIITLLIFLKELKTKFTKTPIILYFVSVTLSVLRISIAFPKTSYNLPLTLDLITIFPILIGFFIIIKLTTNEK